MNTEFRRKPRRQTAEAIEVTDAMTERHIGRIGNLSETGMLLVGDQDMQDDALYQFQFTLVSRDGSRQEYELGAHLLWKEPQGTPGMYWMGFRFIGVPEDQLARLRGWIKEDEDKRH